MISIELLHDGRPGFEPGLSLSEPHGTTHHARVVFRHLDDHGMRGVGIDLGRVGPLHLQDVPGKLNHSALQAWTPKDMLLRLISRPTISNCLGSSVEQFLNMI